MLATMLVLGSVVAYAPAAAANPPSCTSATPLDASIADGLDLPGCTLIDLLIVDNGVSALVPPRGEAVTVNSMTTTGSEELTLVHDAAGRLVVENAGSERAAMASEASAIASAAPTDYGSGAPECFDDANNEADWQESDTHQWFINPSGTPGNIGTTAARTALLRGADNIVNARTDCGIFSPGNGPTGARHSLAGTTTNRPNINGSGGGSCTSRDGINTRGWGAGGDFLAVACTHYYFLTGEVSESDHLYNTNFRWYTGGTNCVLQYDLESVTTHEWGHTFGLDHVSETTSPTMTMSTNSSYCDTSARTLGQGDALAMYAHY